jgi:hypothetical protein
MGRHRVAHKGDALYWTQDAYVNDGALRYRRSRATSRRHWDRRSLPGRLAEGARHNSQ